MRSTIDQWPKQLKEKRGLLNGERVKMARELRGMERYTLARKIGIPAKELAKREHDWHFWDEEEKVALVQALDFPLPFFMQDDPLPIGPVFMCGHNEEGTPWCSLEEL